MDIYLININCAENIEKNLLNNFCKRNFSNEKKQQIHSLSYLMLDRILKEVYKVKDTKIVFFNKKPYLQTREKFFSISHSGEYIVLCFSDFECGVDIERIKDRDFLAISKRMNFQSKDLEDFYYNWTKYEAQYKLGAESLNDESFRFEGYVITASSVNKDEKFELLIQN